MYPMLSVPTPQPDIALSRPLLQPLQSLSNQHAAIALRTWWDTNTEDDLAHHGLRVWREHIKQQNSDPGSEPLPLLMLSGLAEDKHEIALCIFADASAIVLRTQDVARNVPAPRECFQALPIVLSLSTVFRPSDNRPKLSLKVRRDRKPGSLPFIAVSRGPQAESWSDLQNFDESQDGIAPELRQSVLADLMVCAQAWSEQIGVLPVLHYPEQGYGYAASARLGEMLSLDLGFSPDDDKTYACPAFLPFTAYSNCDVEAYKLFLEDAARWVLVHAPEEIDQVSASIVCTGLSQTDKPNEPKVTIQAISGGIAKTDHSEQLTALLRRIIKGPEAPIPYHKLIGQRVVVTPKRMVSSFLSDQPLAFCSVTRGELALSNHQRLILERRFAKYATSEAKG